MKHTITIIIITIIIIMAMLYTNIYHTSQLKKSNKQSTNIAFGQTFTDHMFTMQWTPDKGWHNEKIEKYHPFTIDPASLHMHYGQEIFEGMKAFYSSDLKDILLFRPHDHFQRFNNSATIMSMPTVDVDKTVTWLKKLISIDKKWVPQKQNQSLYIRPTMIATENTIALKPAQHYTFFIILSPAENFYDTASDCVKIMATDTYTRSSVGGVGSAKTGGNYAASMRAQIEAHKKGYDQVLWLDSVHRSFVEEVGTMNIFFVINNTLITPALTNTILPGITRKTVIEIAKNCNLAIQETSITIDKIIEEIQKGTLTEAFGTGTAVGIAPIGLIGYKNNNYTIGNNTIGPVTMRIKNQLHTLQRNNNENNISEIIK